MHTLKPGWVGAPKGMMQILYERGFLDETNYVQTILRAWAKASKWRARPDEIYASYLNELYRLQV